MPCCLGRRRQTLELECILAMLLTIIAAILIFSYQSGILIASCATGILAAALGAVANARQVRPLAVVATVACLTQGIIFVVVGLLTIREAVSVVEDVNSCSQYGLLCGQHVSGVLTFLKVLLTVLGAALFFRFTSSHLKDSGPKNEGTCKKQFKSVDKSKHVLLPVTMNANGGPLSVSVPSQSLQIVSTTRV